jgi:hypothetical protein
VGKAKVMGFQWQQQRLGCGIIGNPAFAAKLKGNRRTLVPTSRADEDHDCDGSLGDALTANIEWP